MNGSRQLRISVILHPIVTAALISGLVSIYAIHSEKKENQSSLIDDINAENNGPKHVPEDKWDHELILEANKKYTTKKTGFVSAFSHGDNAEAGWILSGNEEGKLIPRTRFNKWDGTILLVRANQPFKVQTKK